MCKSGLTMERRVRGHAQKAGLSEGSTACGVVGHRPGTGGLGPGRDGVQAQQHDVVERPARVLQVEVGQAQRAERPLLAAVLGALHLQLPTVDCLAVKTMNDKHDISHKYDIYYIYLHIVYTHHIYLHINNI